MSGEFVGKGFSIKSNEQCFFQRELSLKFKIKPARRFSKTHQHVIGDWRKQCSRDEFPKALLEMITFGINPEKATKEVPRLGNSAPALRTAEQDTHTVQCPQVSRKKDNVRHALPAAARQKDHTQLLGQQMVHRDSPLRVGFENAWDHITEETPYGQ
jgi:hypothetical protein